MQPATQASGDARGGVGKKELAAALKWSRPTLDKRLKTDPKFPVISRGDQSGGWSFSVPAVLGYLGIKPAKSAKPAAIDKAQLRDAVKPLAPPMPTPAKPVTAPRRSAQHQGEATARQRKDLADAQLRENKLRLENAELVERSEARQLLGEVISSIASDLDALPEDIAKHLSLPDAATLIRDLLDKARRRMVDRATPLLADD